MALSVDNLVPIYTDLGVRLRKNIGEYPSWPLRENTIVDLDPAERRLLERKGEAALNARLTKRGMFAFPALDIHTLKDMHLRTCLGHPETPRACIYVPDVPHLRDAADAISQAIADRGCQPPEQLPADSFEPPHLTALHAIILGAAHESHAAATMADRYWLDADSRFPGEGGWLLRSVHAPMGMPHNIIHLCADESTIDQALADLIAALQPGEDGDTGVGYLMQMHPGPAALQALGSFEDWCQTFATMARPGVSETPPDPADNGAFADWLATGFDSGGPEGDRYNRGPMGVITRAARLYLLSGDIRYLMLFKRVIWRLIQYHCNFPGGASYLADYDFEVWSLALYWDLLEEEPIFTDDERLVIANFLLASMRMLDGYCAEHWPTEPGKLRHNHETFPALSRHFGGRYFADHYDLPEALEWLRIARATFSGPIETSAKHLEDANSYQWLVPVHKLVYDSACGKNHYVDNGVLRRIARNVVATTDSMGWPSDFGDAGSPIAGGTLPAVLLEYAAAHLHDPSLQWHADRITRAIPGNRGVALTGPIGEHFGSLRERPQAPPAPPPVDVVALDDHIRHGAAPQMPKGYVFDKLAMRDGWDPAGQYLLLDGYSLGSHFHYDQNAVIRFAQGERLWLVDNGYGKRSGETRAGLAYSGRERGPQDHNTLLVYEDADTLALPAPFSALLANATDGALTLVQSAQVGHGPVDWLRTIVWLRGSFFLIIDQANVAAPVHELRCQFNMLGAARLDTGLLTCDQQDARMFMHFEDTSTPHLGSYSNASWDGEFAAGNYPYAQPPVAKFERSCRPAVGETALFATLFYAGDLDQPRCALSVAPGTVTVTGSLPGDAARLAGHGTSVSLTADALTIEFDSPWLVPADIPLLRETEDGRHYDPLEEWQR